VRIGRLVVRLGLGRAMRTDFLQLRYGRGGVIEPFLARLYLEQNPRSVYWISPWITHLEFSTGNTKRLLGRLRQTGARLIVITREPEAVSEHEQFMFDAQAIAQASIYYIPNLHAKFYIAETLQGRYALLGSANMYQWSKDSYEIGIVIEARGDGEVLVNRLEELTIDLRSSFSRHKH